MEVRISTETHDEAPIDERVWVVVMVLKSKHRYIKKFPTMASAMEGIREVQKSLEAVGGKTVVERMFD